MDTGLSYCTNSTLCNGELAELVAAEDPSRALVSNLGWPDLIGEALVCNEKNAIGNALPLPVKDNCEQLLKLVAAEDPSVALVSDHGWPDTAVENNINSPRNSSSTSYQVHGDQTVTLTLPVVSATSSEQSRGQPLDVTLLPVADEASSFLEVNNSSPELQVDNSPDTISDRPSTNVGKTRPSVIVSRKRALIPAPKLALDLTVEDDLDDENPNGLSPAVLEKRRKGNARCKKYRNNKKHKEAIEETELEMLTRRNEFLRVEEKRLRERKRKMQQSYLSLIRQKKIRFQ